MQNAPGQSSSQKAFLASLFDFSFQSFVTPRIVQVLYGLAMLVVALYTLFIIGAAFSQSSTAGIVALILSPLIFLIGLIFARVYLEVAIVFFNIAENTGNIDINTRR
jgi:hypothetical protein